MRSDRVFVSTPRSIDWRRPCPPPRSSGARSSSSSLIVLATIWGATAMDGLAARLPAAARTALVRARPDLPVLSAAGLLLVVVSLRRLCAGRSSSKAPIIAASGGFVVDRGRRSACRSGARARRRTSTTYGSARWATADEVEAAGLLGPDGVVLGRFEQRLSAP